MINSSDNIKIYLNDQHNKKSENLIDYFGLCFCRNEIKIVILRRFEYFQVPLQPRMFPVWDFMVGKDELNQLSIYAGIGFLIIDCSNIFVLKDLEIKTNVFGINIMIYGGLRGRVG